MRRLILATLTFGALLIPSIGAGMDDDHHKKVEVRIYDRDTRDYHNWNDREDRAYRHYLEERKERYRDFKRSKRDQQRNYWKWRHEHPDRD